jgi:zinc transport system substrate-binding protein
MNNAYCSDSFSHARSLRACILSAVVMAMLAGVVGCGGGSKPRAPAKLLVFVSIPPQSYFVKRIAGGRVDVEVLVSAGQDPHTYSPTAQQMVRLEHAAALFRIGVPFETALVDKIAAASPQLLVVDTNAGLKSDELLQEVDEKEPGIDPHTWLDPRLAGRQAGVIAQALEKLDPANAAAYRQNLAALQADLESLNRQIAELLAPVRGGTFFVFHPAFGYFAKAYGLKQDAVEFEGKSPSPRRLTELVAHARELGVKTIFVQRQLSERPGRTVAQQIGAQVEFLDDLSPDYMNNLLDIAHKIRDALAQPAEATRHD